MVCVTGHIHVVEGGFCQLHKGGVPLQRIVVACVTHDRMKKSPIRWYTLTMTNARGTLSIIMLHMFQRRRYTLTFAAIR